LLLTIYFSRNEEHPPVEPAAGFLQKPPVGPRFLRFSTVHLRMWSSAFNKLVEALVPVFSGSTAGLIQFLKLCHICSSVNLYGWLFV
jgi:hypothetical protein